MSTTKEIDGEEIETEIGTLSSMDGSLALAAVDRAAIDVQIATAKAYPRSLAASLNEALALATMDEETAASMLYAVKRSGKVIDGPSVRLAEVVASSWGNLRVDADIVARDRSHVTAMGTCFDLEKNVAIRTRVKRRITDKKGRTYNDDMIGTTENAAISIALRNAVFKTIPRAYVDRVYRAAREASLGKGGTMTQKRQNSIEWFGKLGVTPEEIFALLEVKGLEDLMEDELVQLRGLRNSIAEGEANVETIFRAPKQSEGSNELNAALGTQKGANGKAPATDAPPTEVDDGSPPTKPQLAQLKELIEKARGANLLDSAAEERLAEVQKVKDGTSVRAEIRALSKRLLEAESQGSLV